MNSGNATMIIPNGEDLIGVPGYTVLGVAKEPWGCPANVVKGAHYRSAQLMAASIGTNDCVCSYACTANNEEGERTANFCGTGRVSPWSANPWNVPFTGLTMQSPLSYNPAYPCAVFVYAPAATMLSNSDQILVNHNSIMTLYAAIPERLHDARHHRGP